MVLSIKKDNSKKPKLSFDDQKSQEDGNKSRNGSLENQGHSLQKNSKSETELETEISSVSKPETELETE
ncbi:hypothetical protein Syun_007650 [Stephania yunnanensis]|uniref:Uncharacterized protein n=1 Tax=Stephania yunnanensis TaxID=152371 RepID=A0AAP0L2L5_9MAGN